MVNREPAGHVAGARAVPPAAANALRDGLSTPLPKPITNVRIAALPLRIASITVVVASRRKASWSGDAGESPTTRRYESVGVPSVRLNAGGDMSDPPSVVVMEEDPPGVPGATTTAAPRGGSLHVAAPLAQAPPHTSELP